MLSCQVFFCEHVIGLTDISGFVRFFFLQLLWLKQSGYTQIQRVFWSLTCIYTANSKMCSRAKNMQLKKTQTLHIWRCKSRRMPVFTVYHIEVYPFLSWTMFFIQHLLTSANFQRNSVQPEVVKSVTENTCVDMDAACSLKKKPQQRVQNKCAPLTLLYPNNKYVKCSDIFSSI